MSITLPPLPERPWRMFCTKCGRTTPLDAKDVQHSPPGSPFVSHFGVCPCGYQALAEQAPWTADQLRAHAAAVSAAKDAEIAGLRERVRVLEDALQMWLTLHDNPAGYAGKYGKALDAAIAAQQTKIEAAATVARAALEQKP